MRYRKLRIAWLIACVAIAAMLVCVRELTYPSFEKFILPSAVALIASLVVAWLPVRSK